MKNIYDICIIGAGPAGYKAALILAKNGKKVCLIEKSEKNIGGTCLNEGCIPAKNYIESANYKGKFSHFENRGIRGEITGFDISSLKSKTDELLDTLRAGLQKKLSSSGMDIEYGSASFVSNDEVVIHPSKRLIKAEKFIIASGSIHKEHPVLKVDGDFILSSKEAFKLDIVPKRILIVGAGAIGCEFANFFNFAGSKVHLCEFTSSILPLEDVDVSSAVTREFKKQSIEVDTDINALSYDIKDDKINVTFEKNSKVFTKEYDKVLVSIGRSPNTTNLKLKNANIKSDERGFIEVDSDFKTSNDKAYAIGDTIATPALAHVAYYEAKKVAYELLGFERLKDSVVPNVVFTTPQVGSVGMSEKTLKEKDINYAVKKLFLKSLGMPKIKGDDSGFVKLLIDNDTQKILGASLVGYDMTEIINQVAICVNADLSLKDINSMIFAHPTISESFYKTLEG